MGFFVKRRCFVTSNVFVLKITLFLQNPLSIISSLTILCFPQCCRRVFECFDVLTGSCNVFLELGWKNSVAIDNRLMIVILKVTLLVNK